MKKNLSFLIITAIAAWSLIPVVHAVTPGEDVATTIILRGHSCGKTATDIVETDQADGSKVIKAKCENGQRYEVTVTAKGKVLVKKI